MVCKVIYFTRWRFNKTCKKVINRDKFWTETCPHYITQSHGSLKWRVICHAILKVRDRLNVRPSFFKDVKQCRLVVCYQCFGTVYPSRLQGLRSPSKCQELDTWLYTKQCEQSYFSNQLNPQFLYSITICMLLYNPRHVSSINMPIFRRRNCIITASGIVTL
jgi:hypothetical protein